MYKESEEMKRVNEEILAKWREIGVLRGLKVGSQNEWRCAKSFDLMYDYLLYEGIKYNNYIVRNYNNAFLRSMICCGKIRINRIIEPKEVFNALEKITVEECFEEFNKKKCNKGRKFAFEILKNFCEYEGLVDKTIMDLINIIISNNGKLKQDLQLMYAILKGKIYIDYEAEITVVIKDVLVKKIKENEGKGK